MKTIIFTSILAVLALLLYSIGGQAWGRGGGYRGGGLRMGSVSHAGYYNRGYDRRGYYGDGGSNTITGYNYAHPAERQAVRHGEVAAATVDPAIRAGMVRPVAVGARIATLPRGYRRYPYGGANYYYCGGGVWYMDGTGDGTEYVATNPPPGVTVVELTGQTEHVVVDGKTLYLCAGIYYRGIWTNGHVTYVVVKAP